MKAQCLPFNRIPHTSRLFTDFLAGSPGTRPFYPRTPDFSNWLKQEAGLIRYDGDRRERVSAVLERQNTAFGSGKRTLENIARLRNGAVAAVTGQQVGLFGGPLFSIFKALTAVKLSDEASRAGVACVPVFWLATEDHDLAEKLRGSHMALYLLVEAADGYRVVFALPELDRRFTERVVLLAEHRDGQPLAAAEGPLRLVVPEEKRHGAMGAAGGSCTVRRAP